VASPARRSLEPTRDEAAHNSHQQEADVRNEQESEEQPDMMEHAPGEWLPNAAEPVLRQRMEDR
jgi:hypothetical protein